MRGVVIYHSRAHNIGETLCGVQTVSLSRFCDAISRASVTLSGWIAWTVFSFGLRFSPNGTNLKTYSIVSSILISFTLIETVFVYIKLYNATKIKDCSVKTVKGLNPGVISKVG